MNRLKNNLQGKKILLGVTGSISAYKIPLLVRQLKEQGADVQCILTNGGAQFVTLLTLSVVSEKPCLQAFTENDQWVNHVHLGLWADLILIAPCSANQLASIASGRCETLLDAVILSRRCPLMLAPAMDDDMWKHPSAQRNCKQAEHDGATIIPPEYGLLASGLTGTGRLPNLESIVSQVASYFSPLKGLLAGKKVLITLGATKERIDPVRYLTNDSSGKMGAAIAQAAIDAGAMVTIISGSTSISLPLANTIIKVESADDILFTVQKHWEKQDIGIFCAAVADYKPVEMAVEKLKKSDSQTTLTLKPTKDILQWAGQNKRNHFVVGFALETSNGLENAKNKLDRKSADLIVLNEFHAGNTIFGRDENTVTFVSSASHTQSLTASKDEIASKLISYLADNLISTD